MDELHVIEVHVVAVHRHEGAGGDIWLVESAGGKTSRLTFDASQENSSPIWSPDESRIVFGSRRNGKWGLYQAAADGTYAKYGLEVTIRPGGPQSNPRALLIARKVEFIHRLDDADAH